MRRRTFIAAAAVVLLGSAPTLAEKIPLNTLAKYISSIQSAQSPFTQINDDGSITTGTIYIKRPGRARFEYDPPNKSLVVAGGSTVAIFDPKSNVPPEQFPLKRTPLNLILAKRIDFNRSKMIVGHKEEGNATVVTAQDPEHPEYGNIQLKFTGNPAQLRQWVITNDAGQQTTVILGDLKKVASLGAGLFSIQNEMNKRGLN